MVLTQCKAWQYEKLISRRCLEPECNSLEWSESKKFVQHPWWQCRSFWKKNFTQHLAGKKTNPQVSDRQNHFTQHLWGGSVSLLHTEVSCRPCSAGPRPPGAGVWLAMNWQGRSTGRGTGLTGDQDLTSNTRNHRHRHFNDHDPRSGSVY